MVAQFPENSPSVEVRLAPKITFSISIQDLSSVGVNGTDEKNARIAEIKIQAISIEKSLIVASVTRIFTHIYNAITNDINADVLPAGILHSGETSQLFSASVVITVNVNKVSIPHVVDFELEISNLKSEYVDDTFSRIKTYLLEAIQTDMNPN